MIQRKRESLKKLSIYTPANRLGIYESRASWKIFASSFEVRDLPSRFAKIAAKKSVRQKYISEVKEILEHELKKYGFKEIQVSMVAPKHFFQLCAMIDRRLNFEDIHDLFAFRIIVNSIKDCYEALGVVHAMWNRCQDVSKNTSRCQKRTCTSLSIQRL